MFPHFFNKSSLPTKFRYTTDKYFSTITFAVEDIVKTIQNFDSNIAHGHVNIAIHMLKPYGDSICKPLQIVFSHARLTGACSTEWKKETFGLMHNKAISKRLKFNVLLLHLRFAINFLKDVFLNKMFSFFLANKVTPQTVRF